MNVADGENSKIYAKLDDHEHRLTTLESTRPYLQDLIERSIKSNEVLTTTMQDVRVSMVKLSDKMDEQSQEMKAMKTDFEKANKNTSEKLSIVESKVVTLEDAGKFDMRNWLKHNFPWIIVIIGIGMLWVSKFVKF